MTLQRVVLIIDMTHPNSGMNIKRYKDGPQLLAKLLAQIIPDQLSGFFWGLAPWV